MSEGKILCRSFLPERKLLFILFGFALLVRLTIAGAYLNAYDTEWNIMWGQQFADHFFSAYQYTTDLDYPPLYFYPLLLVGKLTLLPAVGGYPPLRMIAIKFFPCLTDSLTCVILYALGRKRSVTVGLTMTALWAVNPATLFNCACWGQTDCVLICLAALLFATLEGKHAVLSAALFAAMCCTKLQGLYLAPVVGMELLTLCFGPLHYRSFRFSRVTREQCERFLRCAGAAVGVFAVVYLPFMIGAAVDHPADFVGFWQNFLKPLTVYGGGVDKYPYISMNADNLYMLLGLNGVNDATELLPFLSASRLGTFFLLGSVGMTVAVYLVGRRHSHWLAAYLLLEGIFMLTCRQHERYQIVTLVMLAGALLQTADKRLFDLLAWQSLVVFVNQCRILSAVREKTGWWHYYYAADVEQGAAWVAGNSVIGSVNAFVNVCLFAVSVTLALRFFFDRDPREPLSERLRRTAYPRLFQKGSAGQ